MVNRGALLAGLFSRATVVFLFLVIAVLLAASFYTYIQDSKLSSGSLSALRMASWNLARLGNEASAFDRELALMARGVGEEDQLTMRFDVLWSRYDYLLNSTESQPTRDHADNAERLSDLFESLRSLETSIQENLALRGGGWTTVVDRWREQKAGIQQLVIDNFVGDEASRRVSAVEESLARLTNLRFVTLAVVVAVFVYLAFAMAFVRRQSRTDPTTGLPNGQYLNTIRNISPDRAIIMCEIEGFQMILSDFGHDEGNELLRVFAKKLRKQLSAGDELIHVSQNGFVILLMPRGKDDIQETAERFVEATSFDWRTGESVLRVSSVMGVDPECQDQCLGWDIRYQRAHRALSQARLERQAYCINREDLRRRIEEDRLIHTGLIRFFNKEPGTLSLSLAYQPIVSSGNRNMIAGAEVLLRCCDERMGCIPPNRVVDLCERYGLGVTLGRWIFRQVARENRDLFNNLGFNGNLSINLNPAMFNRNLVRDVQQLLIDGGIPGPALCLEITEDNAALEFLKINPLIDGLHQLGVTFALDDFGTGHSSLEYVRELHVDRLKIDRCFVEGIEDSEDKARFLGSIIALAEQAFIKTVIEGVENEAQWRLVEEMGGELIQGYHAHRPMPMNEYLALLLDSKTCSPFQSMVRVSGQVH